MTMKKIFSILLLSLVIGLVIVWTPRVDATGASQGDSEVTVTVTSYFDEENIISNSVTATYGSTVSFDSSLEEDSNYTFAFWLVDGVVNKTLPVSSGFVVRNDLELTGIFKPNNTYVVLFMDSNGQVLDIQYTDTTGTGDVNDTAITLPSKPGYVVATTKWDGSLTDISADTVLTLQYTLDSAATFEISAVNGTGDGTYALNGLVTLVADADVESTSYFQYWVKDGQFVSNQRTYSFTAVESAIYTAVFAPYLPSDDYPYVILSLADLALRAGYDSYIGQYYLPDGYTFVESGILASTASGILDLGTVVSDNKYEASKINGTTKEFLMSFNESHAYTNVRAYMVCKNVSGTLVTVYSIGFELMISEYGEGSGNNKWIEIYNPTSTAIDLSAYSVVVNGNGGYSTYSLTFTSGTMIAAKDVYVITNASATLSQVTSNSDVTSTATYFNGDDAIVLLKDGVLIDQFGVSGKDPGDSWIPSTGYDTVDKTWVRHWGISCPSPVWYYEQWIVSAMDTATNVGYHENVTPTALTISGTTTVMEENTTQLSVSYSPLDARRGVTWSSDTPSVATIDSSSGLVTGISAGTATITATSTISGTIIDTETITVTARPSYTITASSNNEEWGTVSPTSSSTLLGHDCTITISASDGYYVATITVDGDSVEVSQTSYTLTSVSADHAVVVTFAASASYSISASSSNELYGTVSASPTSVASGGSTTLTISPNTGYKAYSVTINDGAPIYILGQTSYLYSNITENKTFVVTFKSEVLSGSTIGFESSEGFTATQVYNNTTIAYQGNSGSQWGFYYGTSSTTSPIIGLQSAQMRWYTSAPSNLGYTFTNFTTTDVSKVVFNASYYSTYVLSVIVSYSTDGGSTWTAAQTVSLTSTSTQYTVNINAHGNVMLKFGITYTSAPTNTARLYLDGVMIYKLE
jgi:hypothetical protein